MQAIAAKEGARRSRSSPGTTSIYAEKVRKATLRPRSGAVEAVFRARTTWSPPRCGRPSSRYDITLHRDHRQGAGLPSRRPRLRGHRCADRCASRAVLPRQLRPAGQALGRLGVQLPDAAQASTAGATAISSNNNNFVKGAPGEPVLISLDDADDPVPRVRPRAALPAAGHDLPGAGRRRRATSSSTRPRCNEHWLLTREVLDRFARHYKTGEPMPQALVDKIERVGEVQPGLRDGRIPGGRHPRHGAAHRPDGASTRRVRARAARAHRHAARDRAAPPAAALRSSVRQRRLFGRLLQLPLVRRDGCRHLAGVPRSGGSWDKALAERMRTHILSNGNTIDRAEAYRQFRGRDPDVKALLKKRGFPAGQ